MCGLIITDTPLQKIIGCVYRQERSIVGQPLMKCIEVMGRFLARPLFPLITVRYIQFFQLVTEIELLTHLSK